MKKLILFGAMLFLGIQAASAQTIQEQEDKTNQAISKIINDKEALSAAPEEVAEFLTTLMTNKLSLTNQQSAKVKEINAVRLAELRDLWLKNQNAPIKGELKSLKNRYNADLKAAITPQQYAQYEAILAKYKD
jgi:hypothetical protein